MGVSKRCIRSSLARFAVVMGGLAVAGGCGGTIVEGTGETGLGGACAPVDCDGHGTCAVTPEGDPICACVMGFHNEGPTRCVEDGPDGTGTGSGGDAGTGGGGSDGSGDSGDTSGVSGSGGTTGEGGTTAETGSGVGTEGVGGTTSGSGTTGGAGGSTGGGSSGGAGPGSTGDASGTGAETTGGGTTGGGTTGAETSGGTTGSAGGACTGTETIRLGVPDATLSGDWETANSAVGEGTIASYDGGMSGEGSVRWEVPIPCEDEWHIWVRFFDDGTEDSFFVQLDGAPEPPVVFEGDCQGFGNSWDWAQLNWRDPAADTCEYVESPWVPMWDAGPHVVEFTHREADFLGRIIVTNDPNFEPGFGD